MTLFTAMGTKMGSSYVNLSSLNTFSSSTTALNPKSMVVTFTTLWAPLPPRRKTDSISLVNSFHSAVKYTWEISEISLYFQTFKILSMATVFPLVFITNPQLLTLICCRSSSHPTHVIEANQYSQFLILALQLVTARIVLAKPRRCARLFEKRGYPGSAI